MSVSGLTFDLKTRIAAIVLLLFLGGIWLIAYLTTTRLQDDFSAVLANQQLSSVSHTAAEIEQKVRMRFEALTAVAQEISPEMLHRPERVDRLLAERPVLALLFGNGIGIIDAAGNTVAYHPPQPGRTYPSLANAEYFQEVMSTGKPTLGKARIGRITNRPGVAFAAPLPVETGKPAGVIAGVADLSDPTLFGQVVLAKVGQTGWLAVSDARHRFIIAINDPKRVLQPFPKPGVNLMLDRYAEGYEGSGISTNSQGLEVLSSAKQIGTTGWFVQEVLPTAEAFAPIRDMQRRIYLLAAALSVIAAAVVWIAIRHLFRPLAGASADIRRMAAGERAFGELPIRRNDEVGELIGGFNLLFRQRQALQEELQHQARTDTLTDLPNRRHFMENSTAELARVARFGGVLSVLMLDIDHFKKVNDTHGHEIGDQVLKAIAEVCRQTLREIDFIARLGGEEFAALLPGADHAAALDVAERLRLAVAATKIPMERGLPIGVTVSIGITTMTGSGANIDTLLSLADHALYEAKRQGRNRVCGST